MGVPVPGNNHRPVAIVAAGQPAGPERQALAVGIGQNDH